MSDEEKAFVVRDRRGRGDDQAHESSGPRRTSAVPEPESTRGSSPAGSKPSEHAPPVTFSSFVFSLSTSAMMLLGEQLDPQQPKMPVNLTQAKEIIDILSMLEEKTRGNLNSDEQAVLTDMLYALRMKYVDLASGKPSTR